jgi:hypothetical protein
MEPKDSITPMKSPRLDEVVTHDEWEDSLERDWLGAEAAVLVREGGPKRPIDRRLIGVMLVSLGFAVGFFAGGMAWWGMGHFLSRKRES